GHELIAEEAHIGRKIRCPACKVVMIIPAPNPAPVPAPAPAPVPASAPAPVPPQIPPQAVQQVPPPAPRPAATASVDQLEVLPEGPPEGYFEDDRPRKTGMKTAQRMRLANIGLAFHYAKVLCWLVAICLILLLFVLLPLLASSGSLGALIFLGQMLN